MRRRVLYLAGTYAQAAYWAMQHRLTRGAWQHVSNPEVLMGRRGVLVLEVGMARGRADYRVCVREIERNGGELRDGQAMDAEQVAEAYGLVAAGGAGSTRFASRRPGRRPVAPGAVVTHNGEEQGMGKNAAAVALGRKGGKVGGKARAEKLSARRRREIASMGAASVKRGGNGQFKPRSRRKKP